MKKTLFIIVLFVNTFIAHSQTTSADVIKKRIELLMVDDGIFLNNPSNKSIKKEEDALRKAIKYPLPNHPSLNQPIDANLIISGVNLATIGSIIFTGSVDKNTFKIDPSVSVADNLKQVGLVDYNRSNYELGINSSYIMAFSSDNNVDANSKYFNLKATAALKKSNTNHSELNFAMGTFHNRLSDIFVNLDNTVSIEPNDWLPIFDLWVLYCNEKIPNGAKIIKSYDGLNIYENKKAISSSGYDASVVASAQYNIPFLNISTKNDFSWKKTKDIEFKETTFDIYLYEQPQTVSIPPIDDIISCWQLYRPKRKTLTEKAIFNTDNKCLIQVLFGPLPADYFNDIILDKQSLIQSLGANQMIKLDENKMNLVSKGYDLNSKDNMWLFEIEFEKNVDYFKTINSSDIELSQEIKFKLMFSPLIEENGNSKRLEQEYSMQIISSTLPMPYTENIEYNVISDPVDNNYKWKIPIRVQKMGNNNITGMQITQVTFINPQFNYLNSAFLMNDRLSGVNNEFLYDIEAPIQPNTIGINEKLKAELYVKFKEGSETYNRVIEIRLNIPSNIIGASEQELQFPKIETIIGLIDDNTLMQNGEPFIKIKEKINSSTDILESDRVNSYVILLSQELGLKYDQERGYVIYKKYLDLSKLEAYISNK